MGIDIRQLNALTGNDHEKLVKVISYLYQLREQLQYAFDNIQVSGEKEGGITNNTTNIINNSSGVIDQQNAGASFMALRDFIINSGEGKTLLSEFLEPLELNETYVSQSVYGDFASTTNSKIEGNANAITINYNKQQAILENNSNELDKINGSLDITETGDTVKTVVLNGLIKCGILDNESKFGISIGQKQESAEGGFLRYAEFLSNGVFLYDAEGTKVAEISDQWLRISKAIINSGLKIGRFVDTVDGDDIITRWEG